MNDEQVDWTKIEEVALALLSLTRHGEEPFPRVWKSLDWGVTDRLFERGWIGDPQGKAKSVALTEEGARLAEVFFARHFGKR